MAFESVASLVSCFVRLGAEKVYCKFLAENDNSKQQIYLGGSFEVLKLLNYGGIRTENEGERPNFKASVHLEWIDDAGSTAQAPGAQLILYPDYPEVRLSGFLRGCSLAPSKHLQPASAQDRRFNNGRDGRVLFFGVSKTKVFASLAIAGSSLAVEVESAPPPPALLQSDVLREIPISVEHSAKELLVARLSEIIHATVPWHPSMKLDRAGIAAPYLARNGGGYTLEALFGIVPNGRSSPDYLGWEIKAYSSSRVTLMTPEPDAGFYGEHGVEAFLRRYGRKVREDTLYFTGAHYVGKSCTKTGQKLELVGFDSASGKITDVAGGIRLLDAGGDISAEWTFGGLMDHWGRKHAAAAYVPYNRSKSTHPEYKYKNPVLLGEGTDFQLFLSAMASNLIVYDPGPKLENLNGSRTKAKGRSQFRIGTKKLQHLYLKLEPVNIE
jgi:hypothetical protein